MRGSEAEGLQAQRSCLKVLNHLDRLKAVEDAAKLLGAHKSCHPKWRHAVGDCLGEFHEAIVTAAKPISGPATDYHGFSAKQTANAIVRLIDLAQPYNAATIEDVKMALAAFFTPVQMEAHPTDVCNQACSGCTFHHDIPSLKPDAKAFPFCELERLASLRPRATTIAGGGEPTAYKSEGRRFDDYVAALKRLLPTTAFGLITNGTLPVRTETLNQFDWVRISIDAEERTTYEAFRKTAHFEIALGTVLRLLRESSVPSVGAGFVYCKQNYAEAPAFARLLFERVRSECPQQLDRLNIAYRPLRNDSRETAIPFPEFLNEDDIARVERDFLAMSNESPELCQFLRNQTNCYILGGGNRHEGATFDRCGYSGIFHLVRASGEVRPCCMRLESADFYLGNVRWDSPETIALNTLWNAEYLKPGCDSGGCKLAKLNATIEEGLAAKVRASESSLIKNNPFFG
jgi:MoaA/NifB/PqqE/SkfB family radical SAM enzyme